MSYFRNKQEEIDTPKKAILNLTKILPVNQASILNLKILSFKRRNERYK